jgi:hypothetical protein
MTRRSGCGGIPVSAVLTGTYQHVFQLAAIVAEPRQAIPSQHTIISVSVASNERFRRMDYPGIFRNALSRELIGRRDGL